jgi:hypothetical protein
MATSSHFPAVISGPKGSYGLLTDEAEHAVVFVHGFLGDPRGTWHDFHSLIDRPQDRYPLWQKCDLFFYKYHSRSQIPSLAEEFRSFLHGLFVQDKSASDRIRAMPFLVKPPALPSGRGFRTRPETIKGYKDLVLVGHSTGAVIIREAILQELRPLVGSMPTPVEGYFLNALLRFFAPAHRGAICSGPLGVFLDAPISEILLGMWLHSIPLFQNLQAGSPALEDLRRETEELQDRFPDILALIAASLFGADDAIVTIGKYKRDIPSVIEPHQTHISVCKPSLTYVRPLEFVIDAVARRAATI